MSRLANPAQVPGPGIETKPPWRKSRAIFPMVVVWSVLLATGGFALATLLRSPTAGSDKGWALAILVALIPVAFGYIAGRTIGYMEGYRLARTEVDPSEITRLIQLVIEIEKRRFHTHSDAPGAEADEVDDDVEGFERDLDYALEKNAELMRRLAR